MDEMASSYFPAPPPSSFPDPPYSYSYYPPPPSQPYSTAPPPQPPPPSYPLYHYTQPYQHHQHYQPPPQSHHQTFPSYAPPPLPPPPQNYGDDLKTLFVAGLPEDVQPREIYNLFREFPGFQSSQLRSATQKTQPYGFAVFKDQQSAVAAMQELNGLVFDLEKKSTLYINLAKSNSRSKRSRTDDGRYSSDKRVKGSDAFTVGLPATGVGSNIYMPGMGNSAHNTTGYSSIQSHGFDTGALISGDTKGMTTSTPYVPRNNTPCATLFVANLGPSCTEQELNQVFSRCPGFLKLKMQNKNGAPVAFVDFQDVATSTAALNNLQDRIFHSVNCEGMRLEYAKSRMGMRKKST